MGIGISYVGQAHLCCSICCLSIFTPVAHHAWCNAHCIWPQSEMVVVGRAFDLGRDGWRKCDALGSSGKAAFCVKVELYYTFWFVLSPSFSHCHCVVTAMKHSIMSAITLIPTCSVLTLISPWKKKMTYGGLYRRSSGSLSTSTSTFTCFPCMAFICWRIGYRTSLHIGIRWVATSL